MMKTSNRFSKKFESNYSEVNNSFLQRKLIYWIHWTWIDLMNIDMIKKLSSWFVEHRRILLNINECSLNIDENSLNIDENY
jgi:hypothetical protein